MDPSWQKLYDTLNDPNVSKEGKDKIWSFIHLESRRFMEFAYPPLNLSVEDMHKAIDKQKKGQEDNGKRDDA